MCYTQDRVQSLACKWGHTYMWLASNVQITAGFSSRSLFSVYGVYPGQAAHYCQGFPKDVLLSQRINSLMVSGGEWCDST